MTYGLCPVTRIRPLAAYEMESVEPAGGSTVSAVTARNAAARTGRTRGRAPRPTATRPAITPAQPSAIAAHSETVTNVTVRCSACHHGRCPARGMRGTVTLGPAADRTIMTSTAAVMAATENHPVSRVSEMRSEGRTAGRSEGAAGSGAAAGP